MGQEVLDPCTRAEQAQEPMAYRLPTGGGRGSSPDRLGLLPAGVRLDAPAEVQLPIAELVYALCIEVLLESQQEL